jgi:hypothetical protein
MKVWSAFLGSPEVAPRSPDPWPVMAVFALARMSHLLSTIENNPPLIKRHITVLDTLAESGGAQKERTASGNRIPLVSSQVGMAIGTVKQCWDY